MQRLLSSWSSQPPLIPHLSVHAGPATDTQEARRALLTETHARLRITIATTTGITTS